MAAQVTSNGTLFGTQLDLPCAFTASSGRKIVMYAVSGVMSYATSADGITWSATNAFNASPSSTNLITAIYQADTLYLWYGPGSGPISCSRFAFNTSTNLFGTVTTTTYDPISGSSYPYLDVVWDGTQFQVAAWAFKGGTIQLCAFATAGTGTITKSIATGYTVTAAGRIRVVAAASFLYVLSWDGGAGYLRLVPLGTTSTTYTYTPGSYENVVAISSYSNAVWYTVSLENNGNLTIAYSTTGQMSIKTRTGTNSYGNPVPLPGSSTITNSYPQMVRDPSTGDLFVIYSTAVNQTNGEIYSIRRQGGVWQSPVMIAGGDASGYKNPQPALSVTSGIGDLVWQKGAAAVWYGQLQVSSAPNAPANVGPSGNVAGLTPTISWTYSNNAVNDPQGSYEILVTRVSDSVVMWDSGQVSGTAASVTYGTVGAAATALAYNVAYTVQVKNWDSLSNAGAGTAGPYCSAVTFTPKRGGTVTITQVQSNGVNTNASPVSLVAATLSLTASWTQPDTDSINAYTLTMYAADQTTVVATSGSQPLSPVTASGSSFTSITWTPSLANNTTYYLGVSVTDATSGVVSSSALWQVNTAWTPPAAPTGLTAAASTTSSATVLTWTNPGSPSTVTVQRSLSGQNQWVTLSYGTLISTFTDYPPMVAVDYRVQIINSLNTPSNWTTVTSTQPLGYGLFGIWLNDLNTPTTCAPFGLADDHSVLKQDLKLDVQEWVPIGQSVPVQTLGLSNYWTLDSIKFLVLASVTDPTTSTVITGTSLIATLRTLAGSGKPLLYRDFTGQQRIVRIVGYADEPYTHTAAHRYATIQFHDTRYIGTNPVTGQP